MVVLLILAFITLPGVHRRVLELTASYSEFDGKQLEVFSLSGADDVEKMQTETATGDTAVDDPLAAPPVVDLDPTSFSMTSDLQTPNIGNLLQGREAGNKEALLLAYGGTPGTEASVSAALDWLKRYQQRDGTWRLDGPYADGGIDENRTAATAMAMLAFLGAGHTHVSEGPHRTVVQKGMNALLKMEDDDGNFFISGPIHHRLYSQAIATIAVCELYGMSKDEKLREPAQRALNYAFSTQTTEGGWRYEPKVDSDTSVTGWFAMALQSGRMAGLDVPSYGLDGIGRYLETAQVDNGSQYAYQPGGGPRLSMTAEALLCRQYLGWPRDDVRLQSGVAQMLENPISWESGRANVYYWYYATQVLHHVGGKPWFEWNRTMREVLPAQQVTSDRERGSWTPTGDAHDVQGGRLYVTCLCTYMLEVYYRHLPIYHSAGP